MSLLTLIESNNYWNMFMVAISELEVWAVIEGGSLNVKQIVWSMFRRNIQTSVAADLLHNIQLTVKLSVMLWLWHV